MARIWMRTAVVAMCLGTAAMLHAAPAPVRADGPLVEKQEPNSANAGPSTLTLATGVGVVVIAMTIGVTMFPRRRRA